ncbi:hypothetical protein [Novosphingobium album (ex Liu et al. 2023)]|uniref:DUF4105 domain-containing protein n=1 Tax=Novosphingobium album (ex Liu et al. 2023) TaxID=3031130 RepID=A0ABT5WQN4_9SPHN|nr:hypothetical protein [Novosphingobium album (ex Liu et al. 2023)]MDE8652360.1 hypothetical protein [Novosphingobium album (ex Liu et al. 2023)]
MTRFAALLLAALACVLLPQAALAQVLLSFQSFNGSMFAGRYPHTFIVLRGALDETGQKIDENYGYTARHVSLDVLSKDVPAMIYVEKPKYIESTNRHFTVPISDAQYRAIRAEVNLWRNEPYNLDKHNCVHFVARIAEIVGIRADVPANLVRKPKAWLNYVGHNNPWLNGKIFD